MCYRIVILIREGQDKLESIAFEDETDLINEALDKVIMQINGLIPKRVVEGIIHKVKR